MVHYGVTAHQGNSGVYPGNTLGAFESALKCKVDWVELDVHRTRDGKIVVIHDAHTGNVGDTNIVVAHSTYDELRAVDVAQAFRDKHNLAVSECPKGTIPLLKEALLLFKKQSCTKVSIQPKVDCVAEVVKLIEETGTAHLIGFNDGNLSYMKKAKQLLPQATIFWDRPSDFSVDDDIKVAIQSGFHALVINDNGITADKAEKIKASGLEVGVWTVNSVPRMQQLLSIGVDRIYTDFPEDLIALHTQSNPIVCEGEYPEHLQGVCSDGNFFYWSWTTFLVKTDLDGKLVNRVKVHSHHGDLCFYDSKLFVAVNLGKFNEASPDEADSWIYVYDAGSLEELERYRLPEVVHGAGAVAHDGDKFMVAGGLPDGYNENSIYEYDHRFRFLVEHNVSSGYTWRGIQTLTYADRCWWAGIYHTSGDTGALLQIDDRMNFITKFDVNASLGIVRNSPQTFLVASNKRLVPNGVFKGQLSLYVPNR